jgi:hypothetical protein
MDFTPVERDKKPPVSIGQLTEDAMKNAEKTRFGDWLRESPAWNRAMSDLRAQFGDPNATRFDADDWQQKLLQKDGTLWKLGESTVDQIRSMPRPNVSVPGLDNLVVPNVGAPGMPELGSESMPLLGTIATWALFVGIILAAGWQMVRWIRPKRRATNFASDGGPWPVRPEAVATPAELILAFDYLALLKLGSEAQSWNHRAIASHWRELAPAFALDTDALEHLYEQARYEDGISALSDADREQARRALVLLAEAL